MTNIERTIRVIAVAGMALAANPAIGQTVVPSDLSPGDQYRLVFITAGTINPMDAGTDLSVYNTFVTTDAVGNASLAALGTAWTAIGSTASESARDNTASLPGTDGTGIPIYNLNNQRLANTYADLWDGLLDEPILYNRDGAAGLVAVATGTLPDGSAGLTLGSAQITAGSSATPTTSWVNAADYFGNQTRHMYAMSDVLTVVPEPGHYAGVAALGLVAFSTWRRLKARG